MGLFDEFKDIIDNNTYQYITRKNINPTDLKTRTQMIAVIENELDDNIDNRGLCVSTKPSELPYEILHHLVNIPQVYSVIRYKQADDDKEKILIVRDDHAMMMIGVDSIYQAVLAFTIVTMDHYVFRLSLIDKDPYFNGSDIDSLMKKSMARETVNVLGEISGERIPNDRIANNLVEIVERFALGYKSPSE